MTQRQLNPAECWFVGDTISDMNHAKSAQVPAVAVTWGVHSREVLVTTQPAHICDTIPELFTLLNPQ